MWLSFVLDLLHEEENWDHLSDGLDYVASTKRKRVQKVGWVCGGNKEQRSGKPSDFNFIGEFQNGGEGNVV